MATPCLFMQWATIRDPDEAAEAWRALGNDAELSDAMPNFSKVIAHEPTAKAFLERLKREVRSRHDLQVLYVSAHGQARGISREPNGKPMLTYKRLFAAISEAGPPSVAFVTLVLGSCFALSTDSEVLKFVPGFISCVYGFTGCPRASDVGHLLAGVVGNDIRLQKKLGAASRNALEAPLLASGLDRIDEAFARVEQELGAVVESHVEDPAQRVTQVDGVAVRRCCRRDGRWECTTFPISERASP